MICRLFVIYHFTAIKSASHPNCKSRGVPDENRGKKIIRMECTNWKNFVRNVKGLDKFYYTIGDIWAEEGYKNFTCKWRARFVSWLWLRGDNEQDLICAVKYLVQRVSFAGQKGGFGRRRNRNGDNQGVHGPVNSLFGNSPFGNFIFGFGICACVRRRMSVRLLALPGDVHSGLFVGFTFSPLH